MKPRKRFANAVRFDLNRYFHSKMMFFAKRISEHSLFKTRVLVFRFLLSYTVDCCRRMTVHLVALDELYQADSSRTTGFTKTFKTRLPVIPERQVFQTFEYFTASNRFEFLSVSHDTGNSILIADYESLPSITPDCSFWEEFCFVIIY
jgi:hypothetical protein